MNRYLRSCRWLENTYWRPTRSDRWHRTTATFRALSSKDPVMCSHRRKFRRLRLCVPPNIFGNNLLESEMVVGSAATRTTSALGIHQLWFNHSTKTPFKALRINFSSDSSEGDGPSLAHTPLNLFLFCERSSQ